MVDRAMRGDISIDGDEEYVVVERHLEIGDVDC